MDWLRRFSRTKAIAVAIRANLIGGTLIAIVYVVAAVYSYRAIDDKVSAVAASSAEWWVEMAIGRGSVGERLINNSPLEIIEELRLGVSTSAVGILDYRFWDMDGSLRGGQDSNRPSSQSEELERALVREALESGETVVGRPGQNYDDGGTDGVTRVAVPFRRGGSTVGAATLEIDLSEESALAHKQFETLITLISIITTIALLGTVVMAALLRQHQTHDRRIRHLAAHDPLTDLANRRKFTQAMEEALAASQKSGERVLLHFIDLDRFKSINDLLGHEKGDILLQEVASRLRLSTRESDIVARLGGDEFAVLATQEHDCFDDNALAERILIAMRSITELDGTPVNVSVSIGVASSDQTRQIDALQRFADAALYDAKNAGRDRHVVYTPGMDEGIRQRSALRALVRAAIKDEAFVLFYQPLHDACTGQIVGFEGLLRLSDGAGGYFSPADFVPVAEELGLTPQLGRWVLKAATRAAAGWPEPLRVSVNLSPQEFDGDVVASVTEALAQSGLAANRLELEITENLFIKDPDRVERELYRLKALGVRIAMDDFGTGYSSLQHLWKFPFDKLKVDRTCFMSLEQSEDAREILRTISVMSAAMSLRVTAEGIETDAQRAFAKSAGYDELQGFLYSKPMPESAIGPYVKEFGAGPETINPPPPVAPNNMVPFPRLPKSAVKAGPPLPEDIAETG